MGEIETFEEFGEKLEYEWEKLIGVKMASSEFWRYAEAPKLLASMMGSWMFDGIRIVVEWPVAKRQLLSVSWPLTWRDAFKERWFPAWAKRRWPVRYKRITLDELIAAKKGSDESEIPMRYFIQEREGVGLTPP